jgi:hypothetical protein
MEEVYPKTGSVDCKKGQFEDTTFFLEDSESQWLEELQEALEVMYSVPETLSLRMVSDSDSRIGEWKDLPSQRSTERLS